MNDERERSVVVVMGVSGSGKSTVGRALADRLGVEYAEGDDFHPPANVAKMRAGEALDDGDRAPWLAAVEVWIRARLEDGRGGVVACSTLRRRYRDVLRGAGPGVWFLHLRIDRETVAARVASRSGHFMPASLVESQFAALDPLEKGEEGAAVDATAPVARIVDESVVLLHAWEREK